MLAPAEMSTSFIDALHPAVRLVIAHFRKSNRNVTNLVAICFFYHKRDAVFACSVPARSVPARIDPKAEAATTISHKDAAYFLSSTK